MVVVNDIFCLLCSELVVFCALIERVACHRHINCSQCWLCSLLGNPNIYIKQASWLIIVLGWKFVDGILQVLNDHFVNFCNFCRLSIQLVNVCICDDRYFTEYTYQIEVRICTPIVGITKGYVLLFLWAIHISCSIYNQVSSLDHRIMQIPCICYTLVGTLRCKSIKSRTSLLVWTRVGCDIITLPLWVHRVGPALCLVDSFVQSVNTCSKVIFCKEELLWG